MLFCETDKTANLLEWHTRHAIVLGIAKGLRFLHEERHAGPIIHRDLRQSNVLLTHDFVSMCNYVSTIVKSNYIFILYFLIIPIISN
jgi:serine/threonine protein kinase